MVGSVVSFVLEMKNGKPQVQRKHAEMQRKWVKTW